MQNLTDCMQYLTFVVYNIVLRIIIIIIKSSSEWPNQIIIIADGSNKLKTRRKTFARSCTDIDSRGNLMVSQSRLPMFRSLP